MAGSTPIQNSNFQNLLEPGLRNIFHAELMGADSLFKRTRLFNVASSERAYEEHLGIGAMAANAEGFDYRRTGSVQFDGLDEGYKTTYLHRPFARGLVIDREMLDDNLYAESQIPRSIAERPAKLAEAVAKLREKIAAEVFINAFTDSGSTASGFDIAGADAVGMCSTAHKLTSVSGTQSNEDTDSLTVDKVDEARQAMRAFTDDRGELVSVSPDMLLVPPELEKDAYIIANSQLEPGHANNDVNYVRTRIREVVVWDYLTDANAWFLIDDALRAKSLHWYDRVAPEFASEEAFNKLQAKYRAYFRCSRAWSDWRFCYGNNPS